MSNKRSTVDRAGNSSGPQMDLIHNMMYISRLQCAFHIFELLLPDIFLNSHRPNGNSLLDLLDVDKSHEKPTWLRG